MNLLFATMGFTPLHPNTVCWSVFERTWKPLMGGNLLYLTVFHTWFVKLLNKKFSMILISATLIEHVEMTLMIPKGYISTFRMSQVLILIVFLFNIQRNGEFFLLIQQPVARFFLKAGKKGAENRLAVQRNDNCNMPVRFCQRAE